MFHTGQAGTSGAMSAPYIFNPVLRSLRRDRALSTFPSARFLYAAIADELLERLDLVQRRFTKALVIGCPDMTLVNALSARGMSVACADQGQAVALAAGGSHVPAESLPFPPATFDLIFSCGVLDAVNDLPGALIAMRQTLAPDGLCLLAFAGAGSLPRLRAALLAADGDRPAQRLHPQVDVRALGDLLQRAGFALPVADQQEIDVRYGSLFALMADLRNMGGGQALASQPPPITRAGLARAADNFANHADPDNRTTERFIIVHGSGWAPSPDQPRPARRGSASTSLASVLEKARVKS